MAGEDERDTEWRTRQAAHPAAHPGAAPPAYRPAPPAARGTDGLAITGLVLGIVSVLVCWIPFVGVLVSILAIIFGAIGVGRKISTGMGVAGLVLGIVTFLVNVGFTIYALTETAKRIP